MNKALQVGDSCPVFSLKDQNGNEIQIQEMIGKHVLVIFFYPKDNTRGCTIEACSFRDEHEAFLEFDAKVIGISSDSVASHQLFATKFNLPYTLLADTKKEVRKAFGMSGNLFGLLPGRVTYIIDKNGIIRGIFNSLTDPNGHITHALQCIRTIND
jgi:peroxiredoxin Q/BCP